MPSRLREWMPEGKWDRARWKRIAAVAIPAFVVGYLFVALLLFGGGPSGPVVTVPDVRSLAVARAERELGRSDLVMEVSDSLPNPRIRRGAVLAQSPLPGQEVAPESPVRVIVSLGPERRAVPRVDRYTLAQAERILAASGFQVVVQPTPHERAPGRVVGTVPAAGSSVPMPATIRLLVSAGPPILAAPSVLGMMEGEAAEALRGAGLRVGEVAYELRPDLAEGLVLSQFPSPGDSIPAGTAVTLQVATQQVRPVAPPVDETPAAEPAAEPASPTLEIEAR